MRWLLITAILAISALLFGRVRVQIRTIERKRSFYEVKIRLLGIKLYSAKLFLRHRGGVDIALAAVRRRGYRVVTDTAAELEKRRVRRERGLEPRDYAALISCLEVEDGGIGLHLGTGDAAETALLTAALKNAADTALKAYGLGELSVGAYPDFSGRGFKVRISCILSFVPAQIICRYINSERRKKKCIR